MPHVLFGQAGGKQSDRPNILWITCEDSSPALGCYGDAYAATPNLDRLAAEGVRYTQAYVSAPVCSPMRSGLITGVHACSHGTAHLRQIMPQSPRLPCYTEAIRRAGYYCTNNSKEDYNFRTPRAAWDESSRKAHWRNRPPGKPFFSIFNLTATHQGQTRYNAAKLAAVNASLPPALRHDPAKAPLPPYYPDTPAVRANVAAFYTQFTVMDRQVGRILKQLADDGLAEETIVFFYSDHGTGLPRGKRWLHLSGIQIPLIVRFPKKYRRLAPAGPGSTVGRMVSTIDLAATMLSLLGLPAGAHLQGPAFLGPKAGRPRKYVFSARDRVDECIERSRTVHDGRYQYIRNFLPHRPRMQMSWYSEVTPIRREIRRLAREGKLRGGAAWLAAKTLPAEELFDMRADPHEMKDVAASAEHQEILQRLRGELRRRMIEIRDLGLLSESEMHRRAKGASPYDMARREGAFDVERILDAAWLVGLGVTHRDLFVKLLGDADAAVRYWAAVGLAVLGQQAAPAAEALAKAAKDPAGSVRVAAAEALCSIGRAEDALPVLMQPFAAKDPFVQLEACAALLAIGEKAEPVKEQLAAALKAVPKGQQTQHITAGIKHVLAGLGA
jgi:uncharacterized sulfatase